MSTNSCVAYYGLRFEVSRDEVEHLETLSDSRFGIARRAGLKLYWGNFAAPGERYMLFVGEQLAILGPENSLELSLPSYSLQELMNSTRAKLQAAGLSGEPSLYLQWQPDV